MTEGISLLDRRVWGRWLLAGLSSEEQAHISDGKDFVSTRKFNSAGQGRIPVAVAVSDGATVIDFAGPWMFCKCDDGPSASARQISAVRIFMVSDKLDPVTVEG